MSWPWPNSESSVLHECPAGLLTFAGDRCAKGKASHWILLPAFLGTPRAAVWEGAFAAYDRESFGPTDSYRTFALDLEPSLEVLRKNLDQKWRNCLNRAEKNGLTIVQGSGPEEFNQFIRIYDEMWARKQF